MKRDALAEILRRIGGTSVVGWRFGISDLPSAGYPEVYTAGEVEQCLQSVRDDEIAIEEQYYLDYIVHIGKNMHDWLVVDRRGPLYSDLRRHHQE